MDKAYRLESQGGKVHSAHFEPIFRVHILACDGRSCAGYVTYKPLDCKRCLKKEAAK